jgi:hypothetical protein
MFDLQTYGTLQMKLEKLDETGSTTFMSRRLGDVGGTNDAVAPRFATRKLVLYDIVLDRNKTPRPRVRHTPKPPFKFKKNRFSEEISNFYKNEAYRQSRSAINSPRSSH